MNRTLKLSMLAALALGSGQAMALDLGQIQVKSALGQPLRVEIPANPASPDEVQNLSARLASDDAFTRAGITDGRPAVPLQFQVTDDHGRKVILVTSSAPVNNPYIDLLIEVSSAAGTSVHEYPVLLDPPSGARVSAPASHAAPRRAAAAPHRGASAAAPARQPAAHAAAAGQYGPVQRGETLSAVARDVATDGISLDQMMLALKQANPDAFYRDNINALKAGAVLRVPSRDEALATKLAEAAAAVRQQNDDWRAGATRTPTTVAAAATRGEASASPGGSTGGSDRLALVPAAEGGRNAAAGNLRQELQRNQEALASLQQQGADLKSRLKALEDINDKNQRLLSLKDDQIAELQAKLAAARKAAGLPPAPAAAPAPAPAEAGSSAAAPLVAAVTRPAMAPAASASTARTAVPATTTSAATAHAAEAPKLAPPKPAARPVPHKPATHPHPATAEQPWYMQAWAMIAGLAVVVLGLLMLLASRNRRGKPATPEVAKVAPSLADRFGDAPEPAAAASASADPDQDELLDQLAEHPDDVGLHLELVSLYYGRRDVEHFEAAAEAMHAHIADPQQPEWQDVVHMGEDLAPGHPLFARAGAVPPQDEDERQALNAFDLDSYADAADAAPAAGPEAAVPPPLPPRQKVGEYHFDFNLTPQPGPVAAADTAVPEARSSHAPATEAAAADDEDALSSWNFDEPAASAHEAPGEEFGELSDDPVDTKLDLARAYLDMGDPDGARAMLDEVMHEGSQMQKDVARGLLEKLV
ncbi:FimV/HubP family polar landmark protein [Fulvimonas sp. R45]|uniref:FimV/HubP family polar landmark protein n=1 Tax=Fulvimonas sp. R45 TaxID=3045937 RepID=UPI00265E8E92|nr:FimV/HubP family polar landmark protein [Fulvimonas sp. R45]MDO1530574.1 FimV/HubP family polar landmark protein [Fulvimonas sp. R45]